MHALCPCRKHGFRFLAPVICLALALAAGCAVERPLTKQSGFLQDYQRLKQDSQDPSYMWWALPGVHWEKYKRLMIDPVEVRINPKKAQRELTRAEIQKLAGEFRRIVVEELQSSYPVVDKPGPDVLRIRAALTHLVPVMPMTNITTVALFGMPVDLGEAGIEARFSDSQTGRLLSEMTDFKQGDTFSLGMGWSRWGHVRDAFKQWAVELKKAMNETNGR